MIVKLVFPETNECILNEKNIDVVFVYIVKIATLTFAFSVDADLC